MEFPHSVVATYLSDQDCHLLSGGMGRGAGDQGEVAQQGRKAGDPGQEVAPDHLEPHLGPKSVEERAFWELVTATAEALRSACTRGGTQDEEPGGRVGGGGASLGSVGEEGRGVTDTPCGVRRSPGQSSALVAGTVYALRKGRL